MIGYPPPLDIRPRPLSHAPLAIRTGDPLLVTSGGDHWRPVQTCSFGTPPPKGATSAGGH